MKCNIFFLLVVVGFLCSCKKDRLKDEKSFLVGRWTWVQTIHSHGWCNNQQLQDTLTPLSEGKHYTIEFEKKGYVYLFDDDQLSDEGRVVFDYFTVNSSNDISFLIYVNNDNNEPLGGHWTDPQLRVFFFPYTNEPGCENYENYFIKE